MPPHATEVLKGITVLLPKTAGDPQAWGDTRPITLSSTVLISGSRSSCSFAGGAHTGRPTAPMGGQGEAGMGGEGVAGATRSQRSSRLGDQEVPIPQTNGVRQGSPDSPILFGRVIADDLEAALRSTSHLLPSARGPAQPQSGGSYMDDTYLWSHVGRASGNVGVAHPLDRLLDSPPLGFLALKGPGFDRQYGVPPAKARHEKVVRIKLHVQASEDVLGSLERLVCSLIWVPSPQDQRRLPGVGLCVRRASCRRRRRPGF